MLLEARERKSEMFRFAQRDSARPQNSLCILSFFARRLASIIESVQMQKAYERCNAESSRIR